MNINSVQTLFFGIREYLSPVLKNSKFKETGCITPEEFVAAGDFLVYKCPTWNWENGEVSKRRDYLPAEKQFLITRNVPCLRRIKQMEYTDEDAETQIETEDGEAWVATHSATTNIDEISQQIEGEEDEVTKRMSKSTLSPSNNTRNSSYEDSPSDKILQVRTYDLFITYDKYYQTPRMWLFGYDEERRHLTSAQIFEDISQDYAKKTVTIETHPHLNMSLASIHPCRHAPVMKKIIEKMNEESIKKFEMFQQQYGNATGSNTPQAEQGQVRVDQ
ncbi:5028_t:CDS:2 [Entrophospora sp. SA101]|nr:5028_t:CDS:2 [Entrophospora sp. SA101]